MSTRIDWRNYDYSEGPPKKANAITTASGGQIDSNQPLHKNRDTNPYSKSTNFRVRSPTASPVNIPLEENVIDSTHLDPSNMNRNMSKNRNGNGNGKQKSKLIYRAPTPKFSETNETPNTSYAIPRNGGTHNNDEEPFDVPITIPTKIQTRMRPADSGFIPITPPKDEIAQYDLRLNVPSGNEETIHLTNNNQEFDNVWNDSGDDELDLDVNLQDQNAIHRVVSHEDEMHYEDEMEDLNMVMDMNHNVHHMAGSNDDVQDMVSEMYEFESFAGDRSTATGVSDKLGNGSHMNMNRSSISVSEASIAQMEIARNVAPVSILRTSGRISPGVGAGKKKHHHPWDQGDVNLQRPMDEVDHREDISVADSRTNLEQYEANDNDIAQDTLTFQKITALRGHMAVGSPNPVSAQGQENQAPQSKHDNSDTDRKERHRRSRRRGDSIAEEDEDTSIEDYGNAKRGDTLQDRTKQAWSKRNQVAVAGNQSPRRNAGNQSPSKRNNDAPPKRSLVSFQQDTVHEFVVPEEEVENHPGTESDGETEVTEYTERTDDHTYDDDDTYAGRSMHSVYTKSNESEAEDFFKDIFLIGSGKATNPGRRQFRHKKEFKVRYKEGYSSEDDDETTVGENTLGEQSTMDGEAKYAYASDDRKKAARRNNDDSKRTPEDDDGSKIQDDEVEIDAFAMTYNYCDDLIHTITAACGLAPAKSAGGDKKHATERGNVDVDEDMSIVDSIVDYATSSLFTSEPSAFSSEENKAALMELSISAAKTIHQFQNVKYDECHDLKLNHDIKIVKMSVGLPIGIVFEDNNVCCWVTKIFEKGNAAVASIGDKLHLGDQLAAIDGVTAMRKNVSEVCKMLANGADPNIIELTFVRYIGTLHPASKEQQGYEVIDTKLSKASGRFSPINLAKKISFSRPRSPYSQPDSIAQEVIKIKSNKVVSTEKKRKPISKPLDEDVKIAPKKVPEEINTKPKKEKKKIFGFLRKGKKKNKQNK